MKSPSIDVCRDQVLCAVGVDAVIDAEMVSLRQKASACTLPLSLIRRGPELMMPLRLLSVTTEVAVAAVATNDSARDRPASILEERNRIGRSDLLTFVFSIRQICPRFWTPKAGPKKPL